MANSDSIMKQPVYHQANSPFLLKSRELYKYAKIAFFGTQKEGRAKKCVCFFFYSSDASKLAKEYCQVLHHHLSFVLCILETVERLPSIYKMASETTEVWWEAWHYPPAPMSMWLSVQWHQQCYPHSHSNEHTLSSHGLIQVQCCNCLKVGHGSKIEPK